jgi:subtilisin family serine protease
MPVSIFRLKGLRRGRLIPPALVLILAVAGLGHAAPPQQTSGVARENGGGEAPAFKKRQPVVDWASLDDKIADLSSLIVVYKDGTEKSAKGLATLTDSMGGKQFGHFRRAKAMAVKIPRGAGIEQTARRYIADPDVEYVQPNYIYHAIAVPGAPRFTPNDPLFVNGSLWSMDNNGQNGGTLGADIDAPEAWFTDRGDPNTVVAVLDTGIDYTHPDLAGNMWINPGESGLDAWGGNMASNGVDDDGNGFIDDVYGADFFNNDSDPMDDHGHGTHCAGTIGGIGSNAVGVAGVVWNVKLMALKFLASWGGTTAGAMAGIEYAMDKGVKVINNSWGGGPFDQALYDLIEQAKAAGVLMVCAAGNSGTDNDTTPHYPSTYDCDNILAVAAADRNDVLASFSCFGETTVDVTAPGVDIMSCAPVAMVNPPYQTMSGTSMATPHTTGLAALLMGISPKASWSVLKRVIMDSVVPDAALAGKSVSGGHINAYYAAKLLREGAMISFDQLAYKSTVTAGVRVEDAVAYTSSVSVAIMSYSGFVSLTNRGSMVASNSLALYPDSSEIVYTNRFSIPLLLSPAPVHGNVLVATYTFPLVGGGTTNVSAYAPVDDVPPVISNLRLSNVTDDSMDVMWDTDEAADAAARAGKTLPLTSAWTGSGLLEGWGDPAPVSHSVTLTGLDQLSLYYIAARSADAAGNVRMAPANPSSVNPADYIRGATLWARVLVYDDMELGMRRWTHSGLHDCWEFGTPSYGPPSAYSGLNCWGTSLGGNYLPVMNAWLESEPIAVGDLPRLSFMHWYAIDTRGDYGLVEVNNGHGWIIVSPVGSDSILFRGSSGGWKKEEFDLSEFGNSVLRVRFRLMTTVSREAAGWYIDDFKVRDVMAPGVWAYDIERPVDDSPAYLPGNDGDGFADPGERVKITLLAFNGTPATLTGLNGTVDVVSDKVSFDGPTNVLSYGTMSSGEMKTSSPPLVLTIVDDDSAAGAVVPIMHTMRDSAGSDWTTTILLPVNHYESVTGMVRNTLSAPVAGATVSAATTGAYPVVTATTDGSGKYVLHGCVRGLTYTAAASKPGSYLQSGTADFVSPGAGPDFVLRRCFAIPSPDSISLNMFVGSSNQVSLLISNTNTPPVDTNLVVTLVSVPVSPGLSITFPSGSGPFTVPPGSGTNVNVRVDVSASASEGPLTGSIRLDGVYVCTQLVEIPVSVMAAGLVISGTVVDTFAVPVQGATVYAAGSGVPTLQDTTAADGSYSISGLATAVVYAVHAEAPGFSPTTNILAVPPAQVDLTIGHAYATLSVKALVIDVAPGATSNGTFTLSNTFTGAPPEDISLAWEALSTLAMPALQVSFSPSNGILAPGAGVGINVDVTAGVVPTNKYVGRIVIRGNQIWEIPAVVNLTINVTGQNIPRMLLDGVFPADQDSDGYIEAGENVSLTMRVRNTGYGDAAGVLGALSTTSALATVTVPTATYPTPIQPGQIFDSVGDPWISITNNAPEGAVIPFQFILTDAMARSWTNTFSLTVGISPDLKATPTSFNVTLDEGKSATRTLTVSNASVKTLNVALRTELISGMPALPAMVQGQPEIDWASINEDVADTSTLIVGYKGGAESSALAVKSLAVSLGGVEVRRMPLTGVMLVRVAQGGGLEETARRYMADPNVAYVEPNYKVRAYEALSAPRIEPNDLYYQFGFLWSMDNYGQNAGSVGADIDAPEAWAIGRGSTNVIVAVVDTGIDYAHEDLAQNMWKNPGETGLDGFGNDKASNGIDDDMNGIVDDVYGADYYWMDGDPIDDHGHGTHVAGTIGGVGSNGVGVAGVCWNVKLMALKFLGPSGSGDTAGAISCIEYGIDQGVKVMNHSWGGGPYSVALYNAFVTARANGVLMVCAAGNSGTDNDWLKHYPSSYDCDNILAVAATDRDDLIASYSCYGKTTVDIAAPGSAILSTFPGGSATGPYATLSGTSMATPHVAGVAALLMSLSPSASWDMVKQTIMDSAVEDEALADKCVTSGHLSAYRAANMMLSYWLEMMPSSLSLESGRSTNVVVHFNRQRLARVGAYRANITADPPFLGTNAVAVTMTVNPAPIAAVGPVRVDDAIGGDGDGNAEPGETANLYVSVLNNGSAMMLASTGFVSTAVGGVAILQQPSWGVIASHFALEPTVPLRVSFPAGPPTNVLFKMTVNDGVKGPWTGLVFSVSVGPLQTITGRVTDAWTGQPISDAKVDYLATEVGGTANTDPNGFYRLPGMSAGDSCTLRARAPTYASAMWTNVSVSVSNTRADFALEQPIVSVSPPAVTAAVYVGSSTSITVEAVNDGFGWWRGRTCKLGRTKVAVISDGTQLNDVRSLLTPMGLECDEFDGNAGVGYTRSATFLSGYDLVIADLTGADGFGRKIADSEVTALNSYIGGGGQVLLTGGNLIGSPDNATLAAMMGSSSVGVQPTPSSSAMLVSADAAVTGPYGPFQTNTTVSVTVQRYDDAQPDAAQDAEAILAVGGAAKIMRRNMGEGNAVMWTGNRNGDEWRSEGPLHDIFKNLVVGLLAGDTSWLTLSAGNPMTVAPASRQNVTLNITAPASIDDVVDSPNVVLFAGSHLVAGEFALRLQYQVWPSAIIAEARAGVVDWLRRPLRGDGGEDSCVFQVLYAGPDGTNNPPLPSGQPSGDDALLQTFPDRVPFGRFGVGHEADADYGRFRELFNLSGVPAGSKVYVRAWDGSSIANSVAYGDSKLYSLAFIVAETKDFDTWVVDRVVGYPDGTAPYRDWDGDSIPDGYMVLTSREARDPIVPLVPSWSQEGAAGGPYASDFHLPGRVAVSSNLVFVCDTGRSQIQVWNRSLTSVLLVYGNPGSGNGEFNHPQGIAYDAVRKRVIVADTLNCRIVVLSLVNETTGELAYLTSFGSSGSTAGKFINPYGVAVFNLTGWVFVADTGNNRAQIFQYSGGIYSAYTQIGSLTAPKGVGVSSAGWLHVADTGVHTIRCYGMDGFGPYWSFGGGAVFAYPSDVQFGVADRMYVTDMANHRVRVYDMSTWNSPVHIASYGSGPLNPGEAPGELRSPQGATPVLDANLMYVADTGNHRVQLLRTLMDSDGDGMDDIWEDLNNLDSGDPNDWDDDPDGDGLINIGEYRIGTNPWGADTNDNGADDGWEVNHGSDAVNSGMSLLVIRNIDDVPRLINWNVVSGGVYRIQFTPDMVNVPWSNGPMVNAGFDGVYVWTNTVTPAEPTQFFRIQRLNP